LNTDEVIENDLAGPNVTWPGDSNDILVNGQGRLATNATGQCSLAAIDVEPGKTYRLRFIGATALSLVWLAFEGHDAMTIIEADGHYTQPLNASYLQIGSGQRFSVLLSTKPETEVEQRQHPKTRTNEGNPKAFLGRSSRGQTQADQGNSYSRSKEPRVRLRPQTKQIRIGDAMITRWI